MTIEAKVEYQWNQGWASPIAHTDVNAVVKELIEIQEIRGEITPELVVESAKNKKSVLHSYFLWDDEKAANKWRLNQASILLRHIEIKVIKDGEPKIVRAFELTTRPAISQPLSFKLGASSIRAYQIASSDLLRAINRLDPFPEYKVVVSWLKKSAALLSSIKPVEKNESSVIPINVSADEVGQVSV